MSKNGLSKKSREVTTALGNGEIPGDLNPRQFNRIGGCIIGEVGGAGGRQGSAQLPKISGSRSFAKKGRRERGHYLQGNVRSRKGF